GDRAMHVRPGADDDRVDLLVLDQVLPAREDLRDIEFARHPRGRLAVQVADSRDPDARDRRKSGDVTLPGDLPGADDPDPQLARTHEPDRPFLSPATTGAGTRSRKADGPRRAS